MKLKDDIKDWILPALLLTPHAILLMAIWLDKPIENKYPIERLLESGAYLATIVGVIAAIKAYSIWKTELTETRNIEAIDRISELLQNTLSTIPELREGIINLEYSRRNGMIGNIDTRPFAAKKLNQAINKIKNKIISMENITERPLINSDVKNSVGKLTSEIRLIAIAGAIIEYNITHLSSRNNLEETEITTTENEINKNLDLLKNIDLHKTIQSSSKQLNSIYS